MKIIRTDRELETPIVDKTLKAWGHDLVLLPDAISEDELCKEMVDCELLLMCYTPITKRVIQAAPKLKAIVKYGVGIDAIDIELANAQGVIVVNIPEYAEETVAEGAFAMLIALAKKIPMIQQNMNAESWVWPESKYLGLDIAEKTLGIIGCGKIGASMARMAGLGFRVRVIGYDPFKSKVEMAESGIIKYDNLIDMLRECDFISLHVVLNDDTKHLIGKKELAVMKPSAILVNSARGALIDELALLEALKNNQLTGVGLDVFSIEPLNQENHPLRELFQMKQVILFPHLTFYTVEAMQRLEEETLERCKEVIENKPVTVKSKDMRLAGQGSLNVHYN